MFQTTDYTGILSSLGTSGPGRHFGESDEGITYVKLIDDLLTAQFDNVLRVVAFNPVEGWSRDVSEDRANALEQHIAAEGREVSDAMGDFIEGQTEQKLGQQQPESTVPSVPDWIHEIKRNIRFRLFTRNGHDWSHDIH